MFTKIATVVTFCDREVQFCRFVAACIWIFLYEKMQSRLIFLFFRLGYIKFSLFASFAGEICVLHRYGTYLLRCSVLWRAAGRRAKSPKCRQVSFPLISSKLYSTGSIGSDGVEKTKKIGSFCPKNRHFLRNNYVIFAGWNSRFNRIFRGIFWKFPTCGSSILSEKRTNIK